MGLAAAADVRAEFSEIIKASVTSECHSNLVRIESTAQVHTWVTVRGKPSRMKPTRHSGRCTASPMSPTTISSDTRAPESIAFLACSMRVKLA